MDKAQMDFMLDFTQPNKDAQLKAADANPSVLGFMAKRRSALVRAMTESGPNVEQLALILRLAARAPDHRKLFPWRFLVFEGKARAEFGAYLARFFKTDCPDAPTDRVEFERNRFERAPLVVGVVSSAKECSRGTPKWEQELSAGAVCMNMLLAARASGFAAQWLTEWYAFDERIDGVLGLAENERMAGFIYMGTGSEDPAERPRPNIEELTKYWRSK